MWPELTAEAIVLDDEVVTFADLLLLGAASGLLEEAKASARLGMAALEQADLDPSREQLREFAVGWRRARRLESGQDLRAWLEARQLAMEDWEAYLRRTVAAQRSEISTLEPNASIRPDTMDAPPANPGKEAAPDSYTVDLACGGWWERFADLAARLWAAERLVGGGARIAGGDMSDEATAVMAGSEDLAKLGRPFCTDGLRKIRGRELALEDAMQRFSAADALAARVREHANEWTELSFDELLLSTREAANEALLCAREDGLDAAALAARTGSPLEQRSSRRDSLPVTLATILDGALANEPFGPVARDDGWAVLWLRERRRPSIEDAATRAAASAEILEEALERAGTGRIRRADVL